MNEQTKAKAEEVAMGLACKAGPMTAVQTMRFTNLVIDALLNFSAEQNRELREALGNLSRTSLHTDGFGIRHENNGRCLNWCPKCEAVALLSQPDGKETK